MSEDCLFCAIVAGEIPATVVRDDERTLAFRDVNPQAPTHVLVVPKRHLPNAAAVVADDPTLLSDLFASALAVAEAEGLGDGYRLVFNTGKSAGQTVFHAHLHLLGGRGFDWPPG
jgi:histidine triad (HIT) family protein